MNQVAVIAATLEHEIAALEHGTQLPSEHALMRRFDVTRSTVRTVLERLERRHLVRRSQGAGTFVSRRIEYLLSSRLAPSLHETVAGVGGTIRTFATDVDVSATPPSDVATRLALEPGATCTRLLRIGYLDDELATIGEEWLASGYLDEIGTRLRAVESLTELLRDRGATPVRSWSKAASGFSPSEMTTRLDTDEPVPTWCIETLTRDGVDGPPLLFSRGWMRQDRIALAVEFETGAACAQPVGPGVDTAPGLSTKSRDCSR